MIVEHLYQRLTKKGLLVTSENGIQITVSPAKLLTDKDRDQIRRYKAELLALLQRHCKNYAKTGLRVQFLFGQEKIAATQYSPALGQVFTDNYALDCETELIEGHTIPRLALVSVSDAKTHYLVHPADLGKFVLAHAKLPVIFHNAAFDFWVVHADLTRCKQRKAATAWMEHVRQRRMHDTMLLDMLVRLAVGSDSQPDVPRDLGVVAEQYVGAKLDKENPYRLRFGELIGRDWATVDPAFFQYALPDAIATALVYPVLRSKARQLMDDYGFNPKVDAKFDIDPAADQKFGLLTESIQVGASVALAEIERAGMHTDQQRLAKTAKKYHDKMEKAICKINLNYPGLFKLDAECKIKRTAKTGVPCKSTKALDDRLLKVMEQITEKTGDSIEIPRTSKGQIAKGLDNWEPLLGKHPFLKLWFGHQATAKLCQFLRSFDSNLIQPHYRVFCRTGRTTCSKPNMQQVPRQDDFREVIVPAPGHLLLAVDFKFIELVTLAAVCERRFGFSKLADVIRDEVDPHCYTAALLLNMRYEQFMRLKLSEPKKFKQWRQASKGVNFGVPGGLGVNALVSYAQRTYGVEMTLKEAETFKSRLVEEVYPELKLFLADTSLEALAVNLSATLQEVRSAFRVDTGSAPAAAGGIRKVVAGHAWKSDGTPFSEKYVGKVWDMLNNLNRRPVLGAALSVRLGSEELEGRLFSTSIATLTGRIRAGVQYCNERNTQFQGLAADGAKLALTRLVAECYRVVGFVHDEILVELPDEGGYVSQGAVDKVIEIICMGMKEVTYSVPVGCEYTVSTCWSKRAELIVRDDRVYAWHPKR
jgi:DNA polymerase I-like protein with 3'-5' exonuclease and polymerase domains